MYGIGKGLGDAIVFGAWLLAVSVPLGLWKLCEIIAWVFNFFFDVEVTLK